jgi:hypothetical protein
MWAFRGDVMQITLLNDDDKLAAEKAAKKRRALERMYAKLARFDGLPDDAVVDDRVAGMVLNMSATTLRRQNPVPQRQLSARRIGRRVGDLRKLIRESICDSAT